ncbi:hypothetical protein Tco_1392986 [Tanacetum coccineum]
MIYNFGVRNMHCFTIDEKTRKKETTPRKREWSSWNARIHHDIGQGVDEYEDQVIGSRKAETLRTNEEKTSRRKRRSRIKIERRGESRGKKENREGLSGGKRMCGDRGRGGVDRFGEVQPGTVRRSEQEERGDLMTDETGRVCVERVGVDEL